MGNARYATNDDTAGFINLSERCIRSLWYGIFHSICHINPRSILALGTYFYDKCQIIIYNYSGFRYDISFDLCQCSRWCILDMIYGLTYVNVHFGILHIVLSFESSNKKVHLYVTISINFRRCEMFWEHLAKLVMILCSIFCECVLQAIYQND